MKLSTIIGSTAVIAMTLLGTAQAQAQGFGVDPMTPKPVAAPQQRPEIVLDFRHYIRVIRLSVNQLNGAFTAYLGGNLEQTGIAIAAADNLTFALANATMAIQNSTFFLNERDANYTARLYLDISQGIANVTRSLRNNIKAIKKAGAGEIMFKLLPQLESATDCLGAALYPKSPVTPINIQGYVLHYWKKIDQNMEETLKAYHILDYSPDGNPTAPNATAKAIKDYTPLFGEVCTGPNEIPEPNVDPKDCPSGTP